MLKKNHTKQNCYYNYFSINNISLLFLFFVGNTTIETGKQIIIANIYRLHKY